MEQKLRIGFIGGGQLARMTIPYVHGLGFKAVVLDEHAEAPARELCDLFIQGSPSQRENLEKLASLCDVMTYDMEATNVDVLLELSATHSIFPRPQSLQIIHDKYRQKEYLQRHGIPVSPFALPTEGRHHYPLMLKTRTGGYDGHGTLKIHNDFELSQALKRYPHSMLEQCIDIKKELALMVVITGKGEGLPYPVVEMLFDPRRNINSEVLAPAQVEDSVKRQLQEIACMAVKSLNSKGLFAVEAFLDHQNKLYINEIACRSHNSGHYTKEACNISQFEAHIRAIMDLEVPRPALLKPCCMINILGEAHAAGTPVYRGLADLEATPETVLTLYGKKEVKPFRKMGHFTVCAATAPAAQAAALRLSTLVKAEGISA